jgi:hypothetical protein
MKVSSSGDLTFDFACLAPCLLNPDPASGVFQVQLAGGDEEDGNTGPFKVGTFVINTGSNHGDELTLESGNFLDGSYADGAIPRTVLAEVYAVSRRQTDNQTKCLLELNKSLTKVADAQSKDIYSCVKDGAKNKLGAQTIEQCTMADNRSRVAKAKSKTLTKAASKCSEIPDFGPTDPDTVNQVSAGGQLELIHEIFGPDLDAVIPNQADPNTPDAKDISMCQLTLIKLANKCQQTKYKAFNKCKKDILKRKSPPPITSGQELEQGCLAGGLPDQAKIAKACDTKLLDGINKKCPGTIDTATAVPGCNTSNRSELKACVDRHVECQVCLSINAIDGLSHDCDLFDDNQANGSCS